MKIITSNFKKGFAKVMPETSDDLWYLSQIVDPGDVIKGKTLRKLKPTEEAKAIRKPVFMKLTVEKTEFSPEMLRLTGPILEGPEDVAHGSYHTFNVETGNIITVEKTEWLNYQIKRLKESAESKLPKILICVLDREEALFAQMKRAGYEIIGKLKGDVAKKRIEGKGKEFYPTIIKQLEDYDARYKLDKIILASPAFWKEELMKVLKNADLKKKIIQATCSTADENAFAEVLKREETKHALHEERVSKEIKLIDKLLSGISKGEAVAYGIDETEKASEAGAINELLVTDSFINKLRLENKFKRLDVVMKSVDKQKGEIVIISSDHEGGQKLDGIGGIGALLRYKLSY